MFFFSLRACGSGSELRFVLCVTHKIQCFLISDDSLCLNMTHKFSYFTPGGHSEDIGDVVSAPSFAS